MPVQSNTSRAVNYPIRAPEGVRIADDHVIPLSGRADAMHIGYTRAQEGARIWTARLRVDRSVLLPMYECGLFPELHPIRILGCNIFRPIELHLRPEAALRDRLDVLEDQGTLVDTAGNAPAPALDAVIGATICDLRNYTLLDLVQH